MAKGDAQKKRPASRSSRAKLTLPISRVDRRLKLAGAKRVGATSSVFLAAVMEYLIAEVLEITGQDVMKSKRSRIMIEDIMHTIRSDYDLHKCLNGASIFCGEGVKGVYKAVTLPKAKLVEAEA